MFHYRQLRRQAPLLQRRRHRKPRRILTAISRAAKQNNVDIVTGDTKTVEAGAADKIFINTAGIGAKLPNADLRYQRITPGDKIIINGTIGDHGMAIISQREFMRDPTRGGLAATLNEISTAAAMSIEIREADIPVNPTAQTAADMLGFDVLTIANEGKFVVIVAPDAADNCLQICRNHPLGADSAIIGQVVQTQDMPTVELITRIGGRRIVQMPYGRELPRIC